MIITLLLNLSFPIPFNLPALSVFANLFHCGSLAVAFSYRFSKLYSDLLLFILSVLLLRYITSGEDFEIHIKYILPGRFLCSLRVLLHCSGPLRQLLCAGSSVYFGSEWLLSCLFFDFFSIALMHIRFPSKLVA